MSRTQIGLWHLRTSREPLATTRSTSPKPTGISSADPSKTDDGHKATARRYTWRQVRVRAVQRGARWHHAVDFVICILQIAGLRHVNCPQALGARRQQNTNQTNRGGEMMNGKRIAIVVLALAVASGMAMSAQDKYTAKLADGLPLSDWRGYEDWQLISTSKTDDRMKVILGNPTIIAAFKSGIPGNGK